MWHQWVTMHSKHTKLVTPHSTLPHYCMSSYTHGDVLPNFYVNGLLSAHQAPTIIHNNYRGPSINLQRVQAIDPHPTHQFGVSHSRAIITMPMNELLYTGFTLSKCTRAIKNKAFEEFQSRFSLISHNSSPNCFIWCSLGFWIVTSHKQDSLARYCRKCLSQALLHPMSSCRRWVDHSSIGLLEAWYTVALSTRSDSPPNTQEHRPQTIVQTGC